jgi:hypothetical protein
MLEPRFRSPREGLRFVGGTPDVDIWQNPSSKYVILIGGNTDADWAAYHFYGGRIEGTGRNDENGAADMDLRDLIAEKKEEIETYIRLFAPDLVE